MTITKSVDCQNDSLTVSKAFSIVLGPSIVVAHDAELLERMGGGSFSLYLYNAQYRDGAHKVSSE